MGLSAELAGLRRVGVEELRECGQCGTGLSCLGGVATREGASTELGLVSELVGLMCLRRRATRIASAELGLSAQVRLPRGGASAELGLVSELVGLRCLRRRATRISSAELGLSAQVRLPPEEVPVRNWA
ncbi:hypothetical protein F511_30292 [Dorcoceras hygrometricum]|uniref:Uncharacterized protein n=1 Tax=Dorcoceras hygrometricum TaxID=472368 RepID=A0A2Z7BHP3_9LAMI|nr:hypothetical protein F511_30292 [Dorcoceras hygrometricum]